jgi:hypothetical protein
VRQEAGAEEVTVDDLRGKLVAAACVEQGLRADRHRLLEALRHRRATPGPRERESERARERYVERYTYIYICIYIYIYIYI